VGARSQEGKATQGKGDMEGDVGGHEGRGKDENRMDISGYPSVPKGSKRYMDSLYLNPNI